MEFKEVQCPFCGNVQDNEVDNDSHICEECGEIFCSEEEDKQEGGK